MTSASRPSTDTPFLALPPFPKRRVRQFAVSSTAAPPMDDGEADALIARLREARVGGSWWEAQPDLGVGPYVLVCGPDESAAEHRKISWEVQGLAASANGQAITGPCDPWHMLARAVEFRCEAHDPLQLIAGLAGVPVRVSGEKQARRLDPVQLRALLRAALGPRLILNPFTGQPMLWVELIDLCGGWRRLIDSNRPIAAIHGFAAWKRATTDPLLWDGSSRDRYDRPAEDLLAGDTVALWRSRTPPARVAALETAGTALAEVEDGFIRSAGLGAECVPPQSIVVDFSGIYFDPRSPSDLERILEEAHFSPATLERAERLRERIVALGLSKYDRGRDRLERRSAVPHLLVPGQVEDDRAVLCSIGPPLTNLQLLRQVRARRPDAHIIYKPHPDVEAGHRKGAIPDRIALQHADEVVRHAPIASWIELVDEVHVNSSLAGFEALLRGRKVCTHGVPFYAGWGLTEDFGPVPTRRTARRSLGELVAATLIAYPRYVDPVSNLPCTPELLIERLSSPAEEAAPAPSPLVRARRLQGRLRRMLGALVPGR